MSPFTRLVRTPRDFLIFRHRRRDKLLKRLAEETGGRAFFPFKAEDLTQSFQDISTELRSQYSLAYRSTNTVRDGNFRAIRIALDRKI